MDIQKKSIQNPAKKHKNKITNHKTITILTSLILVFILFFSAFSLIKSLDFGKLVFSLGQNLKSDENNQTNILLLGVGGEGHDGSNLTDTVIIANLNYNSKAVKFLSIPRDFYIQNGKSGERINKVYDSQLIKAKDQNLALEATKKKIGELIGIDIQYVVKINFSGFVDLVDAIGGVEVDVENRIYDPNYPKGETIFTETFVLEKGLQTLDGETALKYARSRKTTSDFDRARRQQKLIAAIKEKGLELNLFSDTGKIFAIYDSIKKSITTDVSAQEIIELAKIAKEFNSKNFSSRVLNDDPNSCGGFLYTPAREFFGGAAVLLPAGGNSYMQEMISNYFEDENIDLSQYPIQVLNATKTSGLAGDVMSHLLRNCYEVNKIGNATNREQLKTFIYFKPEKTTIENSESNTESSTKIAIPQIALDLKEIVGGEIKSGIPAEYLTEEKLLDSKIVIELGADFIERKIDNPFTKLQYLTPPQTTEKTDQPKTTTDESQANTTEKTVNTSKTE